MSNLHFVGTFLLLLLAFLFPAPAASRAAAAQWQASTPQGMLMEDKIRLGSTPPSCRNRCNACSPCIAVQVSTLPGGGTAVRRPVATVSREKSKTMAPAEATGPLDLAGTEKSQSAAATTPLDIGGDTSYRSYPSYKPLGWKCRCGDHLFNP